jgi:hypothetical protein
MAGEDELDLLEDEEDEPKPGEPKALRDAYDKLRKQHERDVPKAEQRGYEKAMAEVKRQQAATEAATTLGNPKAADLFLRLNPDTEPSTDAISAFLSEYNLVPQKEEEKPETPLTPEQQAQAMAFQKVGGGVPSVERMTPKELKEKVDSGQITPEQASQALREGRVEGVTAKPKL